MPPATTKPTSKVAIALVGGGAIVVVVAIGALGLALAGRTTTAAQVAPTASAPPLTAADAAAKEAWLAFTATATKSAADRRRSYTLLVAAVSGRPDRGAALGIPGLHIDELRPKLERLVALESELPKDVEVPPVPEKPVHEPPKYMGVFQLSGAVRTCYKDGVLMAARGKYYFVRDAVCPDAPLLTGFVEETGETVDADIGRDGREAIVVRIADRESAADDRADHRKAVAEYEAEFKKKTEEYKKALAERQAIERTLGPAGMARAAEAADLRRAVDDVLVPLALNGAEEDEDTRLRRLMQRAGSTGGAPTGSASAGLKVPAPARSTRGATGAGTGAPPKPAPAAPSPCGCASGDVVCSMQCSARKKDTPY